MVVRRPLEPSTLVSRDLLVALKALADETRLRIFILLTIINMGLALLSCRYRKHAIIPLRHAILVILLAYYFLGSQPAFSFLDPILFHW